MPPDMNFLGKPEVPPLGCSGWRYFRVRLTIRLGWKMWHRVLIWDPIPNDRSGRWWLLRWTEIRKDFAPKV